MFIGRHTHKYTVAKFIPGVVWLLLAQKHKSGKYWATENVSYQRLLKQPEQDFGEMLVTHMCRYDNEKLSLHKVFMPSFQIL